MTMFLFVNLSRECKGAYPHGVAYEIPAGCYAVEMLLAAVLLVMEEFLMSQCGIHCGMGSVSKDTEYIINSSVIILFQSHAFLQKASMNKVVVCRGCCYVTKQMLSFDKFPEKHIYEV